jgi:hypothetical protein
MFFRNVGKFLQGFMTSYARRPFTSICVFMKSQHRNLKHAFRESYAARKFISFGLFADIFPITGCRPAQFRKFLELKFVTCFVLETLVILRWYSVKLLNNEINQWSFRFSNYSTFWFCCSIWNIFICAFNSNLNIYRLSEVSGIWRYVFRYYNIIIYYI